jgi:hypothetical protein
MRDPSRSHDARVKENLTASKSALLDYFLTITPEKLSETDHYQFILALDFAEPRQQCQDSVRRG